MLPLRTDRLLIAQPGPAAAARVVDFYERNREHLAPWEPRRPASFYTVAWWEKRLEADRLELEADRGLRCFVMQQGEAEIAGTVNLSNFVRGAFQSCHLGYSLDAALEGRGLMREALGATLKFAFSQLHLHRVMANYVPTNEQSSRLLRGLGFVVEGYARDYLYINDAWRDHVMTSLVNPKPEPPL